MNGSAPSPAADAAGAPEASGVVDLLIVGGGPAGAAAALRGLELGLSLRVLDYDDVLKRIRDYPKDKKILPDFGGGDKMRFPQGGDLVAGLQFDPIDKDALCEQVKALFHEHTVPVSIAVELTGLERGKDGIYTAVGWDHGQRLERRYLARHVALALGRGVPRRFDIPGNTDGIAYRLSDAAAYVGAPALVIGGGTSAAEAVIAISNAKQQAKDATAVYWSYRGDSMPRVSKALNDAFFQAFIGNGNIRYHPKSEPVAVVDDSDGKEHLSLQVDRKRLDGRPSESLHLEFAKERCIACIGEDIPEAFLASLGIRMATGGAASKKRMVVTRCLETEQPNVYLIGDLLSQAYFEADSFDCDPATLREVTHRGNIKSALRDGVLVAQVVRQRLDGRSAVDVAVADALPRGVALTPERSAIVAIGKVVESAGPPEASVPIERRVEESAAVIVRWVTGNVAAEEWKLRSEGLTTFGRRGCDLNFPDDTLMSESHASISHTAEGYFLRDDGSQSGVFLRVPETSFVEAADGDLVRAGRQFLRFALADNTVSHYDREGQLVGVHRLEERTQVFGRRAPDVTLDAADTTLSRRHLAITRRDGKLLFKDLKSANGTFLRVDPVRRLGDGDRFRIGRQEFSLHLGGVPAQAPVAADRVPDAEVRPVAVDAPRAAPSPRPRAAPPPAAAPVVAATPTPPPSAPASAGAAGPPAVTFVGLGRALPLSKGQTVCEAAERAGVALNAECHAGICGSDPIRILSGAENLDPPSAGERGTLEDICGLPPGPCRLACMVTARGPVTVEIVKT